MNIRVARESDVESLAEVERSCWPHALAANPEQFAARIAAFPEGQLLAEDNGRIVGVCSAQRITSEFLQLHCRSYTQITDHGCFTRSHCSEGEIYQLIGVGVIPNYQGLQIGRHLVDRQIEFARSLAEVTRIVGFTRPARFHRFAGLTIDEYLNIADGHDGCRDAVVNFHLRAGAKIVSVSRIFVRKMKNLAATAY